jgi:hypothetical protein
VSDRTFTDGVLLRASEDRAMEYFINIANILYLLSYFVRDILWLRILTVIAALCLIPYFYFRAEPIMPVIYWNTFFIVLNVYWILRLASERSAQLPAGEVDERGEAKTSNPLPRLADRLCHQVALKMSMVRP